MPIVEQPPRMRIVSDGTPRGTKVYDSTGHAISGITKVEWFAAGGDGWATARLTFDDVELHADALCTEVHRPFPPVPVHKNMVTFCRVEGPQDVIVAPYFDYRGWTNESGAVLKSADLSLVFGVVADKEHHAWTPNYHGYRIPAGVLQMDLPVAPITPGVTHLPVGDIIWLASAIPGIDRVWNQRPIVVEKNAGRL